VLRPSSCAAPAHGLERAIEQQVEQEGLQNIIDVMPERNLGAPFCHRGLVEDSPPQTRA
jgi:hypothetical protein